MKTLPHDVTVAYEWGAVRFTVPAGAPLVPASNLPPGSGWWIQPWPNMPEKAARYVNGGGVLIRPDDLRN